MCSTHFTEYRTNLKHARHGGFQTLDVEHRIDSRRPLDQLPDTTTETDEDGDRRRRRQTKTETVVGEDRHSGDERSSSSPTAENTLERIRRRQTKIDSLWGRAKWQLPYSWRHPWVTRTELDTSPLMRPADSRAHEGCSSLCSPRSSRGTTPVLSFLNLLSGKHQLWSVDSPLRLCQLVWQKSNYNTFCTTA